MRYLYKVMYDTYARIFQRVGLEFRAVEADTGSICGNASHEFHVLADSGEDRSPSVTRATMPPTSKWRRRVAADGQAADVRHADGSRGHARQTFH